MYTRNYVDDNIGVSIPQNYDGIAFGTDPGENKNTVSCAVGEKKISPVDMPQQNEEEIAPASADVENGGAFGGLIGRIGLKGLLPGPLSSILSLDKFKIGKEELLLIGIAMFLLFSKEGDKECAIILLLLLFVN